MKADGKMGQFGYAGKFLRVNLESRKIDITLRDESYYKHYLGGRGTIVHTVLTEVPPHVDPLGPENRLVFAAGLLTAWDSLGVPTQGCLAALDLEWLTPCLPS